MSEPTYNVNETLKRIETLIQNLDGGSTDLAEIKGVLADSFAVLEAINTEAVVTASATDEIRAGFGYGYEGGTFAQAFTLLGSVVTYLRDSVGANIRGLVDNIRSNVASVYAALGPLQNSVNSLVVNLGSEDTAPGPNVYTLLQQIRDKLAQMPKCPCHSFRDVPEELVCDEPEYYNGTSIVFNNASEYAGWYHVNMDYAPPGWSSGSGMFGLPANASIRRSLWPSEPVRVYVSSKDETFLACPGPMLWFPTNQWVYIGDVGQTELSILTRNSPATAVICFPEGDEEPPEDTEGTGSVVLTAPVRTVNGLASASMNFTYSNTFGYLNPPLEHADQPAKVYFTLCRNETPNADKRVWLSPENGSFAESVLELDIGQTGSITRSWFGANAQFHVWHNGATDADGYISIAAAYSQAESSDACEPE